MTNNETPGCWNCYFFAQHLLHEECGAIFSECRRYPPHPERQFPIVGAHEWCGEHKPMDHTSPMAVSHLPQSADTPDSSDG